MAVDSFKYLPRIISTFYQMTAQQSEVPIPWTPLPDRLERCKFGLITTGGLYRRGTEPPFDVEREKREPTWGDPSYRVLPASMQLSEVGASHLHINTADIEEDFNILLPLHRFQELVDQGQIGGLAGEAYSFMGYQGFPPDTNAWQETYGPEVAEKLKAEGVQCVFLTPA
jgi:D-proline reductase (dithiol) PrdB